MTLFPALLVVSAVALFVIWGAYPLAIGAVAALRRPRAAELPSPAPRVSAIIATREAPDVVERRVRDLLASDYDRARLEVVVAVDATVAAERVPAVAARLGPIGARVIAGDAPGGKAAALNAAVREATGDVLVFADSHQSFGAGAVRRLAAAASDPRIGAASGRLVLSPASSGLVIRAYWAYEVWLRARECRVFGSPGVSGAIWAMRRALWAPLPAGLILDDVYTPMRLALGGLRVAFVHDAIARDLRAAAPHQEQARKVRTLTGVLQLCHWLPDVLVPWRNPIWLEFVAHKLLRLLTPWFVVLGAIGAVGATATMAARLPLPALALGLGLTAALLAGFPALRRRLQLAVRWTMAMQAAVVLATVHGARRQWNVWQR